MANQQELIESYHSGEMSSEQMIDFEKQLESDPQLKSENNFQSDIINGLKEVRKSELKSRLNAIDVGAGWIEFAMQSTLVKSFGGVVVATLIGSGVYMLADKNQIEPSQQAFIEISYPQAEGTYIFDFITFSNVESPKEKINLISKASDLPKESTPSKIPSEREKEEISKEQPKAAVPSFDAPSANLVEDESRFESADLDKLPAVSLTEDKKIDVSTENVKSVNVRYKYYDGKLFLKGDFDRAPYEILEINSATGRRIYIQYLDKYYQVKTTDKLSDLPEVADKKLIQELKLLKVNK